MLKRAERIFYKTRYYWKGHITNPFWRPREERRKRRIEAFEERKQAILRPFIPFVEALGADYDDTTESKEGNDTVFCLWFQGEENAPEIVRKCIANLRDRFGERLKFLTEENFRDYVTLPDYILDKWKRKKILPAHLSDIIRIELMLNYGGYWFDATDFVTGEVPEVIRNSDFFMMVTSKDCRESVMVQNCFIRGKKNNPLMRMWRDFTLEYWRREDTYIDYFLVHCLLKFLIEHNGRAKALFDEMPRIVQEHIHDLWYYDRDLPYDRETVDRIKANSFFHKCSYKSGNGAIITIKPGTIADYVINRKE